MQKNLIKKYSLKELAEKTSSKLVGNPDHIITGVEALEFASLEDASFLANLRYKEAMNRSQAGVVFIPPSIEITREGNFLIHEDPSVAFQQLVEFFLSGPHERSGFTGIHKTAVIHPTAQIGSDVEIGPYVTIDQDVIIGSGTRILSHVSIGSGVQVGSDCLFYPHVTIREKCIIKNRVILQPGAVIGSCGFGFSTDSKGIHTKLDQLGIVEIEDDVEIGANTTIDRARFKKTLIQQGTKIDNLVQVGHNVHFGPHNLIVSQTGVSGSVKTGRNVVIGGQAGIVGHIEIASGTFISARGGVSKTISKPGVYGGSPVLPMRENNRYQVHLRRIAEYAERIEKLEEALKLATTN